MLHQVDSQKTEERQDQVQPPQSTMQELCGAQKAQLSFDWCPHCGTCCLGSSFFTMCGQHAFHDSPQGWEARVSAVILSGVGFLGSALMWKHSTGSLACEKHEVHGPVTAASVWLSASAGIGVWGASLHCEFACSQFNCVCTSPWTLHAPHR